MAEQKAGKAKRRVKNPETFRERAQKAGEAAGKPPRSSRAKGAGQKLSEGASKPLQRAAGSRPLKPVAKLLRLIGKIVFPAYLRNSWRELKQVTWPTWKQSRQLTFAVLIFAVVFGASIAVLDYGLDKIFRNILLK